MNKLSFKLASYDIEGNFLGFNDLTDQLFLCNVPPEDLRKMTSIGTTFVHRCSFDLQKLTNPALYPKNVNIFYEMYLVDYNGNLIDVPVKMWNQQERQGGQYTNQQPNMNEWQLTRRFFIYDTVSGISEANGFENKDVA